MQKKRILILGESHHWSGDDSENEEQRREKERSYRTQNVMDNYLRVRGQDPCYRFFDKIVQSFGYDKEERGTFWEKVWFCNYVDNCLCGVGDAVAKNMIRQHRTAYNNSLFTFINENGIDALFCFSRLVFNNLPGLTRKEEDKGKLTQSVTVGNQKDYIGLCVYQDHIAHPHVDILLDKELYAYCMRHPSGVGGYKPENYVAVLHEWIAENENL